MLDDAIARHASNASEPNSSELKKCASNTNIAQFSISETELMEIVENGSFEPISSDMKHYVLNTAGKLNFRCSGEQYMCCP